MRILLTPLLMLSLVQLRGQPVTIELQLVNGGLSAPVAIANAGDDRLFVVERAGRIRILRADGTWAPQPFLDITDRVNITGGEQGLLGLAFHPAYATNGYFYVHYTGGSGVGDSRITRFMVGSDPNTALGTSETPVWSVVQPGPNTNHRGGDIKFGPDGMLYIALGDAGGGGDPSNYAQNRMMPFGKILRIDVDGGSPYAIPADNPFVGVSGTLPEIWAIGLRNPWRFSIDEVSGDVWIGDVGQDEYEEIDRWPGGDHSGPNFGWRCYEGPASFNTSGCGPAANYVAPLVSHALSDGFCAIVGGHVYRGTNFTRLQGRYIYTDWCLGRFIALTPNGGGFTSNVLLDSGIMGFAAIGENAQGELYTCNQQNGNVYRIADPLAQVRLNVRTLLEGPFETSTGLMRDDLRVQALIPSAEPYSATGLPQHGWGGERVGTATLNTTGNNAIVDWVRVELRQSGDPTVIVATANALIQRDGDIVAPDGSSPVLFTALPGSYHVVVRHRNHLSCMTAAPIALSATAIAVDLSQPGTATFGTNARKSMGARMALWAGDALKDGMIAYTGEPNDRDHILQTIGGIIPTNSLNGYHTADCNMDGTVRYTGELNDRDMILVNVGGTIPTNTVTEQLP